MAIGTGLAILGGAALGIGGSLLGSDKASSAANKSNDVAQQTASLQDNTQREMFNRTLYENQPYRDTGLRALAQYQSAVLGGPVDYADPGYMMLTSDEVAGLNNSLKSSGTQPMGIWGANGLTGMVPGTTTYDTNKKWYRGPNGEITDKPPTLQANYDYKASPSLIPQTRAYNRALASRGLSGSGQAASGIADLANNDYTAQLSRLSGLAGVGQSASNANAGAGQALGNSLSNIYGQSGQARANALTQGGEAKAGLYSGIGGAAMGAANTYMLSQYLNK